MKKKYTLLMVSICCLLLVACHSKDKSQEASTGGAPVAATDLSDTVTITTDTVTAVEVNDTYTELVRETWKDVPQQLTLTYEGYEFGDYPYITFIDETGDMYDFGEGANDFGKYADDLITENSKYIGQRFDIRWEWKESTFNCCEGSMDLVTAQRPSVVSIQLHK